MKISQQLIDEMISHAREDLPNECCGLISGKNGQALSVHRITNEEHSHLRYRMHGQEEYDARKAIEAAGEEILGAYHSHTRSHAYPSQTDVNQATAWPELIYVIVSLEDEEAPDVKAYDLADLKIADVHLDVT
jgi:[CysO sulfur-carrier protein]-S-L-cysteine hydrolase